MRTRRAVLAVAFAVAAALGSAPAVAGASPAPARVAQAVAVPRAFTCKGTTVVKPKTFVISCADANSELTKTTWKTWTRTAATGTTDFGLNLCKPYCAASKISFFPKSAVRFSVPVHTKHHGLLFSLLVVTYEIQGHTKHFTMSWKGVPDFNA